MEQEAPQRGSEGLIELPIFPLNVVLFPGMPLPLHIFEERYKTMIGQCLERDTPFGIVLIKEGPEVGGPADPFSMGTTARIVRVEHLEGGRMNILTEGQRRFSIVDITQRLPYLKGTVQYVAEDTGHPSEELVRQARELFGHCMQGLAGLRGGWVSLANVPKDLQALTYAIAHSLELSTGVRQSLLEAPSVQERLEQELPLLQTEAERLRRELLRRTPFQGFRLN